MPEPWRIHRARTALQVFDVLQALGIQIEYRGTHQISCPNPEHEDRRPSARVYADDNRVHCFRCGTSWDVLDLVQILGGLSLEAALDWCEQTFGLPSTAEAGPEIVTGLLRRPSVPDLSALAEETETALIARREVIGLDRCFACFETLDVARVAHAGGNLSDDQYREVLAQLRGVR